MNDNELPIIEHAVVRYNEWNRVEIIMDDGWVYWLRCDFVDENGEYYTPDKSEIGYSRYGVFSPDWDFEGTFVVEPDSDVSEHQIYGSNHPING